MKRVTWRGIRRYPVRFALTIVAVALGVAFMTGTFSLRSMMSATYDQVSRSAVTGDIYLRGIDHNEGIHAPIPLALADQTAAIEGVERALPAIESQVVLTGSDGKPVRVRENAPQRPGDQSIPTPSTAIVVWPNDPNYTVSSGQLPSNSKEIALEQLTAENAKLSVGAETTIVLGGKTRTVTVVGIITSRSAATGETIVAVDETSGIESLSPSAMVSKIALYAKPGADAAALAKDVSAELPKDARAAAITRTAMQEEAPKTGDAALDFVPILLTLFAIIALGVGGFIIANTFAMSVRQRMRELAVLRALGASPTQVFGSVIGQAAIVGLLGSLIGVAGGFGVVQILRAILETMGLTLSGAIPVEVPTMVISALVGTLVAILASILPAWRAAKTPPVQAMRAAGPGGKSSLKGRGIVGGVLAIGGIVAIIAALPGGANAPALLGVGAVALFAGTLVVAPAIVPTAIRLLAWPLAKAFKPLGALARGSVTAQPRRTANTASALTITMALVGVVAVLAVSVQASMGGLFDKDIRSDFVLQSGQGTIPAGAVQAVKKVPQATSVEPFYYAQLQLDGADVAIGAARDSAYETSLRLPVISGELASLGSGQVIVQKDVAEENGWSLGQELSLVNPNVEGGATSTVIIGAVIESSTVGSHVIVPISLYDELVPEANRAVNTVFLTAAAGEIEALRDSIVKTTNPFHVVSVWDAGQYRDAMVGQVGAIMTILYALLGLSIVIAILGIVNTLALSVMERTREIGLLRAVGLGRFQLSGTIMIESTLITLFGTIAGLAIGVGIGAALPSVMADMGFGTRVMPWGQLAIMFALAAGAGVIAALWPAVRASRLPVLEAITQD